MGNNTSITFFDGKPSAVKVARSVWGGGKVGDNIKDLPITICGLCGGFLPDCILKILLSGRIYGCAYDFRDS